MGSVCTPVLTRSGRLASPLACLKKKQEKQKSHTAQSAMKTLDSCTGMLLAVDSSSGCCFLGHPKKTKYEWLGCSPFEGCVPLPTVSSASLTLTPSLRQNIARRSKVRAEHLKKNATHSSHFFTTFACSNSLQKYHMRLSCRTWAKMTKLPGRIRHCYTGYTSSSSSIDQDSSMMFNVPFESLESPHCHVEVPAGKLTNIPKGSKG